VEVTLFTGTGCTGVGDGDGGADGTDGVVVETEVGIEAGAATLTGGVG